MKYNRFVGTPDDTVVVLASQATVKEMFKLAIVSEFNKNHDKLGRFASTGGSGASGLKTRNDCFKAFEEIGFQEAGVYGSDGLNTVAIDRKIPLDKQIEITNHIVSAYGDIPAYAKNATAGKLLGIDIMQTEYFAESNFAAALYESGSTKVVKGKIVPNKSKISMYYDTAGLEPVSNTRHTFLHEYAHHLDSVPERQTSQLLSDNDSWRTTYYAMNRKPMKNQVFTTDYKSPEMKAVETLTKPKYALTHPMEFFAEVVSQDWDNKTNPSKINPDRISKFNEGFGKLMEELENGKLY